MSRLARIKLKIERAKYHISNLESRIEAFRQRKPYVVTVEDDKQYAFNAIITIRMIEQPPSELGLIAGDAIQNIRSSLDHLAWQLVEANGRTPTKYTEFPIQKSAPDDKRRFKRQVEGIHADAIDLIDRIQPHKCGVDTLSTLHDLNNFDKHRLLLVATFGRFLSMQVGRTTMTFSTAVGEDAFTKFLKWNRRGPEPFNSEAGVPFENDTITHTVLKPGDINAPLKLDDNFNFNFSIAFSKTQIVDGEPVVPLLKKLSQFVDGIVGQFSPFLA